MVRRVVNFVRYVFIFLYELIAANIEVVKLAIKPKLTIRPGFLAVPIEALTDFEITSLANSITLTPGTISVHVASDRKAIIVHAIDIGKDPDDVRRSIKNILEQNILRWTRSEGPPTPTTDDESSDDTKQTEGADT